MLMIAMSPRMTKFLLMTHISFSVGWMGTVAAFLALAIAGSAGNDQLARACYMAMEIIAWFIIVPFSFASLVSGLIQATGTQWGLFRHWWIVVKLILTTLATALLMLHMKPISHLGEVASQQALSLGDFRNLRIQLIADAAAAVMVLLVITTISVYKPWGQIRFGIVFPRFKATTRKPLKFYLLLGFALVVIIFIVLHLKDGGMHH